ncbi:exodeoxyribonuclease V subunit beta [Rhodanobacter glycinis]|uniref:RecBCD enzyme subunit RecB n=1 Tax=Rhodanobacter glycinis TaxID=582702 RepID=A0A502CD32_9GAMM|nr:exodeoxyribonuclease V subunit beta [Rhodanobacter glycinis]TPG10693.1 exodeoxyribonuclease V subunit beta [Rhodanobacter glycinis]
MNRIAPLDPLRLPLHGIQLIEASAGTGKTWTIAALYLRLVLGHGEHAAALLPPQILVVTFTKAATAELRERIRTRLSEAAEAFRGRGAADDFLTALVAEYPDADARARAARQLELAAQWMDEAAVHTIHGWCQRMLSQHAFDSGHAFVQTATSDESELLAEAVRDYWRQQFFALDSADAAQITSLWKTPQHLQASLRPLLRQPAENLRLDGHPLPVVADLAAAMQAQLLPLRQAQQQARALWLADAEAIEALLDKTMQAGAFKANMMKPENFAGDLLAMRGWAAGGEVDAAVLARYAQAKLVSATRTKFSPPEHAAFAAIGELPAPAALLGDLRALILAHAVPRVSARLEATKQRLAQLGFDDMLKRLDAALHGNSGERLAQTIATQYPVALIDEFQDTDPLQWRIFQRIYGRQSDTGLLLIGDPKQAIYGFRGADIHTYLLARRGAARPTWTLTTNYRSTPSTVKAVNRVFDFAERHPQGAFLFGKGDQGLPFLPVTAQGRKEQLLLHGQPMPALQLAVPPHAELMSKGAYQKLMAEHAAATLVQWLDAARQGHCGFTTEDGIFTPLVPGDIAILVRKGSEAADMRRALQARGLASVYLSDRDSVYASAEARDLLLWLHACAEPGSDRAMRAALASPTLGQSYAELDRLNLDEQHWERSGERFRQLHDSWLRHGVLAMLHELLHLFDLPAQLLARSDGERALTNLLHLAELLQQAAATLDGEHALIRHLAAQIAQADDAQADTADEQIVRLESEAALIKVVTIHKSKGLEYPLVLLPFACSLREVKSSDSFVWHDRDDRPALDLQPSAFALEQAERERLQEDLRLLYVALTRARHACWLGIANLKDGQRKSSGLHKSAFGYVLAGGEPIDEDALRTRLEELRNGHPDIHIDTLPAVVDTSRHQPASQLAPNQPAREYRGQPVEPWWIASYSALKVAETEHAPRQTAPETAQQDVLAEVSAERVEPRMPIKPDATPSIHTFPRGAEPGTFLHGLLEWAADEGFASTASAPSTLRELIAHRCQRHGWQAWSEALTIWLPAFLGAALPLPDGGAFSLAALTDTEAVRAELEFWFEAHRVDTRALDHLVTSHTLNRAPRPPLLPDRLNGMLKGFIDLVLEHDGRYYIVDYKSNWLGSDNAAYTVEAMRDSVLHSRYDLQYAIYTLALHRQLRARLPGYDYARHIGGVLYLYLRGVDDAGHGVHREHLPFALIEAMDQLFSHGGLHDAA